MKRNERQDGAGLGSNPSLFHIPALFEIDEIMTMCSGKSPKKAPHGLLYRFRI